jgi:hypothetical protein
MCHRSKNKVATAYLVSIFKSIFDFLIVTRGVKKAHHKIRFFFHLPRLFCSGFFNRVFGRFVTGEVQKRD